MKRLMMTTLVAATIALMSAMPVSADSSTGYDYPLDSDPNCQVRYNGVAFTDDHRPYICNFDIDRFPFDTVDTYADPALRTARWSWVRMFSNGTYYIDLIPETGQLTRFAACGVPSWGCSPHERQTVR